MRNLTPVQNTILHPFAFLGYSADVVAKSTTSRDKLNNETLANTSTPFNRAFFIRSLRTSKENTFPKNRVRTFLSMVGRNRQPLAVGCVPMFAVCHPITSYRQTVTSLAVVPKKLTLELLAMTTYLFAGIVRTDLSNKIHTLRIEANSLLEARAKLAKTYVLVCIGKLPHSRTNQVVEVANV